MKNKKGFTLVELLVVVLIVGILAAVALPQYQKTMERSRAAEALTLLKSVNDAYQLHHLATGSYANSFDELSVDLPWTGNTQWLPASSGGQQAKSNSQWIFQISTDAQVGQSVVLHIVRRTGKYKGAGFSVALKSVAQGVIKDPVVKCFERLDSSVNIRFNSALQAGAYCEGIMHWKFNPSVGSSTHRCYFQQ